MGRVGVGQSSSTSGPAPAPAPAPSAAGLPVDSEQAPQEDNSIYSTIARAVTSSLAGALPPKHMPTLRDGDTVVRESGAIVDYLVEKYGNGEFTPRSRQGQLDNTFFMHYAEGSFMPPLVLKVVFNTILEKSPFLVRPFTSMVTNQIGGNFIDPALASNFALVDEYLRKDGGRRFLAGGGEPTGGDFMMSFPVEMAVTSGAVKPELIPDTMRSYLERIQARPAHQQASQRYQAMMQESSGKPKDTAAAAPAQLQARL